MTTRKFSATNLPHPRYSLVVGGFNIGSSEQQLQHQHKRQKLISDHAGHKDRRAKANVSGDVDVDNDEVEEEQDDEKSSNVNLPSTCLPRFSQLAQVIEVKKPGLTLPNRVGSNIKDFLGSYCIIENARPELFIRRDFISKFVDKGTIFVAQLSDHQGATATTKHRSEPSGDALTKATQPSLAHGYSLTTTENNVMIITMNSKQYHRFGLLATKVISPMHPSSGGRSKGSKSSGEKLYRVMIDLRDERIMRNNRHQDKLVRTLRRLNSLNKIYFRFIPDKSKLDLSIAAAQELSLEYFNYVINEYNLDGCKPVPLTRCSIGQQKMSRNWINYSQLHPSFELSKLIASNGGYKTLFESQLDRGRNDEKFANIMGGIVDVIDWLGYQLLSLDCDKLAELHGWNASTAGVSTMGRYDVSCTQLIGAIDFEHVQHNLDSLFRVEDDRTDGHSEVMFRALFLYGSRDDKPLLVGREDGVDSGLCSEASSSSSSVEAAVDCETTTTTSRTRSNSCATRTKSKSALNNVCEGGGNDCLCISNRCVVYLQDCSNGPRAATEITVIGLSDLEI